MSHITRHTSHITRHMSHVTRHTRAGASWCPHAPYFTRKQRVTCDGWFMMCYVWYVNFDVWRMTYDVWRVTCDVSCVIYDVWLVTCDVGLGMCAAVASDSLRFKFQSFGWAAAFIERNQNEAQVSVKIMTWRVTFAFDCKCDIFHMTGMSSSNISKFF